MQLHLGSEADGTAQAQHRAEAPHAAGAAIGVALVLGPLSRHECQPALGKRSHAVAADLERARRRVPRERLDLGHAGALLVLDPVEPVAVAEPGDPLVPQSETERYLGRQADAPLGTDSDTRLVEGSPEIAVGAGDRPTHQHVVVPDGLGGGGGGQQGPDADEPAGRSHGSKGRVRRKTVAEQAGLRNRLGLR